MFEDRWRLEVTCRGLAPLSALLPGAAGSWDDLDDWLDREDVPDGVPFLISPGLEYDIDLKRYFLRPALVGAARNTQLAAARDVRRFLDFLWCSRGGRRWQDATEADHDAYSFAVVTLEQLQRGHLAALAAITAEQRGHDTKVFGDPLDRVRRRMVWGWWDDGRVAVRHAVEVPDPHATTSSWSRDVLRAQVALDTALAEYQHPWLGYVGDWHSHPAACGASGQDLVSIRRASRQYEQPLVLLIHRADGVFETIGACRGTAGKRFC